MGRKRKNNKVPKVHEELTGLDMRINEFGEMVSNLDMDKINAFLTRTVPDKKLINRHDDAYQQEFKDMVTGNEDEDVPNVPSSDDFDAADLTDINSEEDFEQLMAGEEKDMTGDISDPDPTDNTTPKGHMTAKKKRAQ